MINIFQHLESVKGKPIPLVFKLINNLPLTNDDLTVNGNLNLFESDITHLPDNLTVNGYLNLTRSKIKQLPNNLTVNGWLELNNTIIQDLPDSLRIEYDLFCDDTPLGKKIKNDENLKSKYKMLIKRKIYY